MNRVDIETDSEGTTQIAALILSWTKSLGRISVQLSDQEK